MEKKEKILLKVYNKYFNALKGFIPGDKQSIFDNIGKEIWQNHMMAHLNDEDEKEYVQLGKILVYETFYCQIFSHQVYQLNRVIAESYVLLEEYLHQLLEREKPTVEMMDMWDINLVYAGIKTTTYWVIGYPGETEEDFQKTLDLVEEMKDDNMEHDGKWGF